jgi:membrane protease YdiL (CAAX protease family)
MAFVFTVNAGLLVWRRHRAAQLGKHFRFPKSSAAGVAFWQFGLLVFLWGFHGSGAWTLSSVGVSSVVSPAVAFATGLGEYYLFSLLVRAVSWGLGMELALSRAALRANSMLLHDDKAQRTVSVGILVLANPVTEELVFRGLLVHQFHVLGAPLWLAIAIGAVVSLINHAYQGRALALFHLAFYGCVVALLYSPVGLVGAIGMHFGADLWPLTGFGRNLRTYRAMRRRARRASASAPQTPLS